MSGDASGESVHDDPRHSADSSQGLNADRRSFGVRHGDLGIEIWGKRSSSVPDDPRNGREPNFSPIPYSQYHQFPNFNKPQSSRAST